ncbi:mitochondrial tryptophanyl-tRNA synthetase [Scheffersomyces xylosifermentans]|uniref:mitochondrial tryptophanyl-tRNA synthetase n=1 Tax=Scheffersomyces xylosifermentans TaxID=1304137 RepID=UPI00315CC5B9
MSSLNVIRRGGAYKTRVIIHGVRKSYSTTVNSTVQTLDKIESFPENSTIFSLIQPTGNIHLGNYLGAIRGWKELSETESQGSKFIFGIADLHAITLPKEAHKLKQFRYEAIASILAGGLNPDKCIVFHQSAVPEHTELSWYLTCITSMGSLNRMTQWKSKAQQTDSSSIYEDSVLESTKAGLLCYPILQAADILIYRSTHVPVGDDQTQHLELTRGIANTFNHTYNTKFFPIPKTLLTPSKKILSLRNPGKKMSKSDPDQNSCVYVTDEPDVIAKKIRKATTDSIQGRIYYDPEERPGVSNLINVISGLTGVTVEQTVKDLEWVKDHKQFKDFVTELIVNEFKDSRELYNHLLTDLSHLDQICKEGGNKAREIASANITEVRKLIGMD